MKPYPSYKDSDVGWIGEIPRHWTVKRLKYLFTSREERSETGEEELLSVTIPDGVVRRRDYISNDDHISRSESLVGYKVCHEMDLVNNIMKMSFRCLGISNYHGIVSPAYSVFYFEGNENVPSYWNYLLRIDKFVVEYRKRSKGLQESRMRLYDDYFLDLFSYLPSLPEQQQISNYLDQKTKQIDDLIEKTQQKIELLKEKRTSLINHCVTKGLDPNVEMKDSGVEWIGEIPRGWEIRRTTTLGNFNKGRGIKKDEIKSSGIPCIRYGEIYTKYDRVLYSTVSFINEESSQNCELIEKGDVLFTGSGETIEDIGKCVVNYSDEDVYVGGDIIILKLKEGINPLFISYLMNSDYVNNQKSSLGKGGIIVHIYSKQLKGIKVPLPPLPEQQQIVTHLDKETRKIDTLIEKENKRIELLKEYRQSLISEVVTGKIDVRDEVLQ